MLTATCKDCRLTKPLSDFSIRKESGKPRTDCKACNAAKARVYRANNLDQVRKRNNEFMRYYREGNAEMLKEKGRQRYARVGRDEQKQRMLNRKENQLFRWRSQLFNSRFKTKHTAKDLACLWKDQRGRCALTGEKLTRENCHIDHKIPIARGGSHELSNLRWVIATANLAKRELLDDEFFILCRQVINYSLSP